MLTEGVATQECMLDEAIPCWISSKCQHALQSESVSWERFRKLNLEV